MKKRIEDIIVVVIVLATIGLFFFHYGSHEMLVNWLKEARLYEEISERIDEIRLR